MVTKFEANVSVVIRSNARVGDELIENVVEKVLGRNGNGERMIDLCEERKLVAGNIFKKKDIHNHTWKNSK